MAILELGGGFAQADLDAYFRSLGIPSPEVTAAGVDGASNQSVRTPTGFQPARSGLSGDPAGREPDHRRGDLRSGLEQQARPRRHRWRGQRRLCAAELAVHIRCSRSRRPDRTGGTRRRRQCRPAGSASTGGMSSSAVPARCHPCGRLSSPGSRGPPGAVSGWSSPCWTPPPEPKPPTSATSPSATTARTPRRPAGTRVPDSAFRSATTPSPRLAQPVEVST